MKKNKILSVIAALLLCSSVLSFLPSLAHRALASDEGLVMHLKFDDDATDSSGNSNNGTCYGNITYEEGVLGKAAVFDGASYIDVKDADTLDLQTNFTVSLWAYKEFNGCNFVPYLWKENNPSSAFPPYGLYDHWTNSPNVYLNGKGIDQFSLSGTMLDIGEWNLITFTYDGSVVSLYYNGKLICNENSSGTLKISDGNLDIGYMNSRKLYFLGKMDDFRIYSRAISAQEVTDLFDAGVASNPTQIAREKGVVAHYAFEDNYEDSSIYKNNGELLSESDSVAFVPAMVGKGIRLGDGSYIEVPENESLNLDKGFTAAAWMYADEEEDVPMPIFYRVNSSMTYKTDSIDYGLLLRKNKIDFYYQPFISNTSFQSQRFISKTNLLKNWMYVTLTSDGKEMRWYIDGKLASKAELTKFEIANANGSLTIGTDGKNFFTGILDELKLYNYPLTADEVKKEYNRQDSLSISKDNQAKIKSMKAKATVTLTVNRNYIATGDSSKITKDITYSSSNTKVFKVSKTGKITAVKKGTATLTISHGGISASYKITVK